jgi:hypothetical protein
VCGRIFSKNIAAGSIKNADTRKSSEIFQQHKESPAEVHQIKKPFFEYIFENYSSLKSFFYQFLHGIYFEKINYN